MKISSFFTTFLTGRPCLDVHGVEEPVYGHKEQVEEVDGGALDHPIDPGGRVLDPDTDWIRIQSGQ
jgi:hypothetical protein